MQRSFLRYAPVSEQAQLDMMARIRAPYKLGGTMVPADRPGTYTYTGSNRRQISPFQPTPQRLMHASSSQLAHPTLRHTPLPLTACAHTPAQVTM